MGRLLRAIGSEIGRDELTLLIGLGCVAAGFWQGQVSAWRAAALVVPGLVVLWVALPSRHPFIMRPPEARRLAGRRGADPSPRHGDIGADDGE